MEGRYIYKEQDITLDVIMKIEHVTRMIAEKEGRNFDDCYKDFIFCELPKYKYLGLPAS